MGMDGNGLSVADALALSNDNGGMFGGNGGGAWVFFLFFLLAWGGGGFGGFGNSGASGALTRAEMQQGFDMQNIGRQLQGIQSGLCDGFYAQNTTMLNGFNGVGNQIAENRFAAQQCCCETNRNIDSVRYENARNTCDIVNAIREDGALTRAQMTQTEMQNLRDQLNSANLQLSQQAQSASLISELRPCAKPAYITCSPYMALNGYGCGCGC